MDVNVVEVPTAGPCPYFAGVALVLLETPSNPGLDVCDIAELAAAAHAAGALLAVDNTTATPLGQRPLELGADIVIACDTKAVAGHSDVLFGHVTLGYTRAGGEGPGRADHERRDSRAVRDVARVPRPGHAGPAAARQAANAAAIYALLGCTPRCRPALAGRVGTIPRTRWRRSRCAGSNGVLTFELADVAEVAAFLTRSQLMSAARQLRWAALDRDRRAQWGDPVPEGLVRFSAGCEDTRDLVADVSHALGLD